MSANIVSFCRFPQLLYHCFTLTEVGRHKERTNLPSCRVWLAWSIYARAGESTYLHTFNRHRRLQKGVTLIAVP